MSNPFSLLGSDDDEPEEVEAPKPKKEVKKTKPRPNQDRFKRENESRNRGRPNNRRAGGSRQGAGGARTRGQQRGGGGGARPQRENQRRAPRREKDRQSGTGRGKETKKEGHKYWGGVNDDLAAQQKSVEGDVAPAEGAEAEEPKPEPVKQISYEEYKQNLAKKQVAGSEHRIRKVEGDDTPVFEKKDEPTFEGLGSGLKKAKRKNKNRGRRAVNIDEFQGDEAKKGSKGKRAFKQKPAPRKQQSRRGGGVNTASKDEFPSL
mmetsp:Transcript_17440/g.19595  ORF Transcript_17440/g.19595 Transcript_17440/m.19595 type:complete len:262 (+) Transcript_17440:46-831(+)